MTRLLTLLLIILNVNVLFSQQTLSDTYTPSSNGYIMTVPFEFKFLNCIGSEGIPHLSVSKKTKKTSSNKYKYNGKNYTESELGSGSFSDMRRYIGYTDIKVDIYDGNSFLGTATLTNVTSESIGCYGQTYDVFKKLGINGKPYKDRINALSVSNLRIIKIANSDAGLHMKISDYNKNKEIESLLESANYNFTATRYDDAEDICNEIKKIEYSNPRANEILEEIRKIRKKEKKEEEYEQYISKGHDYYGNKDFINAKKEYQKALNTNVNNSEAERSVWDAEKAEETRLKELEEASKVEKEEEELEEAKREEFIAAEKARKESEKEDREELKKFQDKLDAKRAKEDADAAADAAQVHRNIAKAREEAEKERKKKQAQARRNLEKSTGDALGSVIGSWANGDSYLRFSYGIRELRTELGGEKIINDKSNVNVETIEMGYGFGKLGIFLGAGGVFRADLASPTTEGRGFTGFGGLEYTIFKHRKGYALGINTEIGFGKLTYIDERNEDNTYTNTYRSPFYSFGAQVNLFKFLFVSYNYGFHTTKNTLSTSNGNDDVEYDDIKGNFSKIGVGLVFDMGY